MSFELPQHIDFPDDEFDKRILTLKKGIVSGDLDAVIVTTPAAYHHLTGYETGSSASPVFLVVPANGDPRWVMRAIELGNLPDTRGTSYSIAGVGMSDVDNPAAIVSEVLKEMGLSKGRIGLEYDSLFFPISRFFELRGAMAGATFVNASNVVEKVRYLKSQTEIACMRVAGEITRLGFVACLDYLREGVTDSELASVIMHETIRRGSGRVGGMPYISIGSGTLRAHSTWHGRKIKRGEIINVEFASSFQRYNVPLYRGMCVGQPDQEAQELHDASLFGLEAGLSGIKAGMTSHQADSVVRSAIHRYGFGDKFNIRAAYGIGLGFPPSWGDGVINIRPNDPLILEPGMTFHLVPWLTGERSAACVSMPFLVTESGTESLVNLSGKVMIAP